MRRWTAGLAAAAGLALPGCLAPHAAVEATVAELAARPLDSVPAPPAPPEPDGAARPQIGRLDIPPVIRGATRRPVDLPPLDRADPGKRDAAIDRRFPELPPLPPLPAEAPGPAGRPLTLAELQRIAAENSPVLKQAAAAAEAARGAAIQAGLYPNPTVGLQGDSIGEAGTAGQIGGYVQQLIVTAGKRKLAAASALTEFVNAEVAVRRARVDLATAVRTGYFAVLVAREAYRTNAAMAAVAGEVFRGQIDLLKAGEAAAYEAQQLRVLYVRERAEAVQARNRYLAAWRQLAAALGLPDLPPTQLAGDADAPIPAFEYEAVKAAVLANHTDVATAVNGVLKARYDLRLADVTPIPDVNTYLYLERDHTADPRNLQAGGQVGVSLPVWDRNQGNRLQARGQLARAQEEVARARNDLSRQLADAFERYTNNVMLVDAYRDSILPDQVGAYRGVYQRYQREPEKVNYNDIVVAQETLARSLTEYLTALGAAWAAAVDVAALLQTDEFFVPEGRPSSGACLIPSPAVGGTSAPH